MKITVIILTRNEAGFVERAIRSASWADEILVLDSESTDNTRELAAHLGATVCTQPWLGWLGQKARAVELAKHDWIFSLDADEIITPELAASIRRLKASEPQAEEGFVVDRQDEFLGRLMPSIRRPSKRDSFVRLFNRTRSGWDPAVIVHEEVVCPGRLHKLGGPLLHWRNYQISEQLQTLNRNSDLEARMLQDQGLSRLVLGMTAKPLLRFGWIYLWCGCWRAGWRGFIFAALHGFTEWLRHAKAWEVRFAEPARNPPPAIYVPEPDHGEHQHAHS